MQLFSFQHDLSRRCFLAIHARKGLVEWAHLHQRLLLLRASSRGIRLCSSSLSTEKSAAGVFQTVGGAVLRANHEPRVAAPHRSTYPGHWPARCPPSRQRERESAAHRGNGSGATSRGCGPKVGPLPSRLRANLEESAPETCFFGASACAARRNRRKLNASHDPRQRSERARQLWPRCPHEAGKPGLSRDAGPAPPEKLSRAQGAERGELANRVRNFAFYVVGALTRRKAPRRARARK